MTNPRNESFSEYLPDNFNRLRPRDTAYPKVAGIFKYIADKVAAYEDGPGVTDKLSADVYETYGLVEFDEEVGVAAGIPRHDIMFLECIDSDIEISGLFKTKAKESDSYNDLLIVNIFTDVSEIIAEPFPVSKYGHSTSGWGQIVFGREMAPVLVSNDKSEHKLFSKDGFNADAWDKAEKTEITDNDAVGVVAVLSEMRDDVTGYDRSTWPKTE